MGAVTLVPMSSVRTSEQRQVGLHLISTVPRWQFSEYLAFTIFAQ